MSALVLDDMDKIATRSAENGLDFKLREGYSAETSGVCNYMQMYTTHAWGE